jgi:quercetin 2,3-dioxygenase
MQTILHKTNSRGTANFGWLQANYSFSFGSWHNPTRNHFGMLRVLNDDIVQAGFGFGKHPHDNMEIITIPLQGTLAHEDSTGAKGTITPNDVQVMSAGSGVEHCEFNNSNSEDVNLFQLWIFPNKKNVTPRYDQKTFIEANRHNVFETVVAPFGNNQNALSIHQDAWVSLGNFEENKIENYTIKKALNGIYLLVIEGEIIINNTTLFQRDAIGIWDVETVTIANTTAAKLLLVDVPMH